MALDKKTIDALIPEHCIPYLHDLWSMGHPLFEMLMQKHKTYDEKRIDVELEYSDPDLAQFTARMKPYLIGESDPVTTAYFIPKTMTAPLAIPFEERWENMSLEKVLDLIEVKVENLRKSVRKTMHDRLWDRGTTGTNEFSSLDDMIGTGVCGGITPADLGTASLWQSHHIDVSDVYNDDPTEESNLLNENSDVYILNLLDRGIAKASYMGQKPDLIYMSTYLRNIVRRALFKKFGGTTINERYANVGIKAIDYDDAAVVAEEGIVENQTSDNDSRIYVLNTDFLWLYFNSDAVFEARPFVEFANINAEVMKILAFGNLAISNRAAHCRLYNIKTPRSYAAP